MKIRFPSFSTSFTCDCTLQEAIERIMKAVNQESNNMKLVNSSYSGVQKIVISTSTGSILYRNSFLPITTIEIKEENNVLRISMLFELRKSIRILIAIYCLICAFFEMFLTVYVLINNYQFTAPMLMPLGLILFILLLSFFGLKFSSRGVLRVLFDSLTQGAETRLPRIYKVK